MGSCANFLNWEVSGCHYSELLYLQFFPQAFCNPVVTGNSLLRFLWLLLLSLTSVLGIQQVAQW